MQYLCRGRQKQGSGNDGSNGGNRGSGRCKCLGGAATPGGEGPTRLTPGHGRRTLVYSLSRCCALVIAASTDWRLTRDLMLEAVPYSLASMAWVWAICGGNAGGAWVECEGQLPTCSLPLRSPSLRRLSPGAAAARKLRRPQVLPSVHNRTCDFGGRMRDIIDVPFPLALSRARISCAARKTIITVRALLCHPAELQ
jgi:hypothetical protein